MQLIELPHKVCACSCMINGLEDLYEEKTGERLPDWLLLHLSGLLGFVYIKNKQAPAPRMVFWGSNLAKRQYETLADVVGFRWQMTSQCSFPFTLRRVKECVDQGLRNRDDFTVVEKNFERLPIFIKAQHIVCGVHRLINIDAKINTQGSRKSGKNSKIFIIQVHEHRQNRNPQPELSASLNAPHNSLPIASTAKLIMPSLIGKIH